MTTLNVLLFFTIGVCYKLTFSEVLKVESNCTCVPYYLCADGEVVTDGANIFDKSKPCENHIDLCCSVKELTKIVETVETIKKVAPVMQKTRNCGIINPLGLEEAFVPLNANQSKVGEFPWMVAILEKNSDKEIFNLQCGGSLIHPQVILTAASCFSATNKYKARGGEWDYSSKSEKFPHQDRNISSTIIHSEFDENSMRNDIALAILEKPFELAENIATICLPNLDTKLQKCLVTGWGKNFFGKSGTYQQIPKKITVPIVPKETCQSRLRETKLGTYFELSNGFICAGGDEGIDSCLGDGGGPLVCPIADEPEKYQQFGIVLWGVGCGTKNIPGVYLDVTKYRSWVDEKLSSMKIQLE